MKVALLNPRWSFDGSIYFGCREPHLPLELGYAAALLEQRGHEVLLLDAQAADLQHDRMRQALSEFGPDLTALTTAPSYLFWRCAPPELRVPLELLRAVRDVAGEVVVIGPHASTTPAATLRKLDARYAIMGECEEALVELASTPISAWSALPGVASCADGKGVRLEGKPRAVDMRALPAVRWSSEAISRHAHHHHRFDSEARGPGAELESSRGCPYSCTFCAKDNYRTKFRQRPLRTVLEELDGLIAQGVTYVYFVDEIFLPNRPLLEALVDRPVQFGVQMRIDLFDAELLELLGRAGCVSIEAGVESISHAGRSLLAKRCRLSTEELTELLITAKRHVPFVQANLLNAGIDDGEAVRAWRAQLERHGVWSNDPVPMFPYPGSPDYSMRWGKPDDVAWERALEHYLQQYDAMSELQEARPRRLDELEACAHG
jgi:B12-binding domain/radical SAM domain protein of rhizo-twelve system